MTSIDDDMRVYLCYFIRVQIDHLTIGSYMTVTLSPAVVNRRVSAEYHRKQAIKQLQPLGSTLIKDVSNGLTLTEICARLKVAGRPKGPGGKNRPIQERIERRGMTFLFRADDASAFADRHGNLSRRKMRRTAAVFTFEGPLTVTKTMDRGRLCFSVTDGVRSFLVSFKEPYDVTSGLVVIRRGSFKQPTGRSAISGRFAGRGPSGSSE
jgi:hypothetical protein